MNVPKVVGWSEGETPTVPQGFRIEALATGLANPRNVYPLPNGDLLIVESRKEAKEPIERPKRPVMDWIEAKAHGGSGGGSPSNRILLLRGADGNGKPAAPTRPHRQAQCAVRRRAGRRRAVRRRHRRHPALSVHGRPNAGRRSAAKVIDLPAGPHQSPLDEEPDRERRRLEALRRRRLEQQRDGARHRGRDQPRRDLGSRSGDRRLQGLRQRAAQPERPDLLSRAAIRCGPSSTSATSSARTWCPTT